MSLISLLAIGLVCCAIGMATAWAIATRMENYGIVDIAWSASVGLLAALYWALAPAVHARGALVLVAACGWSLRLTTYLYHRVMTLHPAEDTRYQDLRRSWGTRLRTRMFWFFEAQAVAAVFFSLPCALAVLDPSHRIGPLEWIGLLLWTVGLAGESLADGQLARFKKDPAMRGRICDVGLWRYSRHPNYFFEWIIWCGFACMALSAPWGFLALACPAMMLWLLLRVTGIPATEAAAVARRGDAYREYQRRTSPFVPWFPSRP